jgi:polysaccharide export outer membrane protein
MGYGDPMVIFALIQDCLTGRRMRCSPLALFAGVFLILCMCLQSLALAQNQPVAPQSTEPAPAVITVSKPTDEATPLGSSVAPGGGGGGGAGVPAGNGGASGDYILQPGDTVELVVYREPDLNMRSKIGKDGMVQLPLLGEVKLAGLSLRSASVLVRQRYNADYVVEPQIYLNIAAYNPRRFTIIGQVGRPGTYEFAGSESLGMLEAVGMAGGFTRIADRGHVLVKRREGDAVRTIKVNAKKLSETGIDRFELKPGDVINVGESWY